MVPGDVLEEVDGVIAVQILGAQVDGDVSGLVRRQERSEVATHDFDDVLGDRRDEPDLLGQRDEQVRADDLAVGASPSHQCLGPDARRRTEIDERLIVDDELPLADGSG